jgi:hypothetical protein
MSTSYTSVSTDKLVKILLFDKDSNTVLVNNKFMESKIEPTDYIAGDTSDEKAAKEAARRTLRKLLDVVSLDESRLTHQTLTEEDKKKYVYIVCYRLLDIEKTYIQRKSNPGYLIGFYPINNLPTGLIGIDGGIAYYITRHFDVIKTHVYLNNPAFVYPNSIVAYKPLYPIPLFTSPVVYYEKVKHHSSRHDSSRHDLSRHDSSRHKSSRHESSRHESSRHESSRHKSSSKSPSKSSSKSSSKSRYKRKERKLKAKYIKYKTKYLELKKLLEN